VRRAHQVLHHDVAEHVLRDSRHCLAHHHAAYMRELGQSFKFQI
jgi:hypothetical protein